MDHIISAREEIERCIWLPYSIKELLYSRSVAVNTLFTPVNEVEIIERIQESVIPIVQIAYAHEVPPHFTRERQYAPPVPKDLNRDKERVNITEPWLYGFIRHPNKTYTLVMFIRGQVIDLTDMSRPRLDPKWEYIRWVFDQYRRLTGNLSTPNGKKPKLRIVGALPGVAERYYKKWRFSGYEEEVKMMQENNENSARFVIEATRQTLERFGLTDSDLILLGSSGTLGKVVSKYFPNAQKFDFWPKNQMKNLSRHLVLDMTWGGSLEYYKDQISKETIWLNEAFPPPIGNNLSSGKRPRSILHIQGVEGHIVPSFPYWYGDIPPCCMGNDEQDASTVRIMEIKYDRTQIA
jgi:hypothetical protein